MQRGWSSEDHQAPLGHGAPTAGLQPAGLITHPRHASGTPRRQPRRAARAGGTDPTGYIHGGTLVGECLLEGGPHPYSTKPTPHRTTGLSRRATHAGGPTAWPIRSFPKYQDPVTRAGEALTGGPGRATACLNSFGWGRYRFPVPGFPGRLNPNRDPNSVCVPSTVESEEGHLRHS